jgi:hypothetical protein
MDFHTISPAPPATPPQAEPSAVKGAAKELLLTGSYDDQELLDLWKDIKQELGDHQWVFHKQWQRNLWYVLGRQWITYQSRYGGWRDIRMASWIPRPVTNKCKETVQAIRAMFTSIKLSVNVRPNGADPKNVSAAATADDLAPLLHETHLMNQALSEFDFWLCVTGNAFFHTYMDYDIKHGQVVITAEQCAGCGQVSPSSELAGAQPVCPECGGSEFTPAMDPMTGAPIETRQAKGIPATVVLSPFELDFPHSYTRFDELPYVRRSRWRTKRYYESHPVLKELVPSISWSKSPSDHSLALFTSLAQTNDLGVGSTYYSEGLGQGSQQEEGVAEYEVWMKPCDAYPDGLVFRVAGDNAPVVLHLEDESLPGPLPYKDADGNPLFTFAHGCYEHVGGRILGSGALDPIIQKQDMLNQHDSQVTLCFQRMGNPIWLLAKGSEIAKFTGMPGLVAKWDPFVANGLGKPERIPGVPVDQSAMALREQYLRDIEELSGTFEIIKGQKPSGVEANSAIQALIERSQARFSSVFMSRGEAYKNWYKFAIELEREFGPDSRTRAVLSPARTWTFQTFKRAQLQGSLSVVVEDGSTAPKTNLGMRAAVEHANSLGMLNMADPDQQYEGLKLFGLTRMVPTLDIHVQAALQKQQAFEEWVIIPQNVEAFVMGAQQKEAEFQQQTAAFVESSQSQGMSGAEDPIQPMPQPMGPPPVPPPMLEETPLKWYPWYSAQIHLQEFLKWANDDHIRELIGTTPIVAKMLEIHMQDMTMAMAPPPMAGGPEGAPAPGGGAGKAMANSNQNSAPTGNTPQPEPDKKKAS